MCFPVVTFQDVQRVPLPAGALVALSFLRLGTSTRAARLFREEVFPRLRPGEAPDSESLLRQLAGAMGVPSDERGALIERARNRCRVALLDATRTGLGLVTVVDAAYPAVLREIVDPPLVLWTRGGLAACLASPLVAIVGSRNATPDGLLHARRLGNGLSEAGVTVVSGLARGIDAAAHRGAIEGPGSTVAVLGCGCDVVYPRSHRTLSEDVVRRGCLVSEYPPGMPPLPRHFPLRNRIISGLSRAVIVVEASEKSGSLITARAALEQGRDVLAVPGTVASGCHRGCHALIKDGARLVETVEDVLEAIGHARQDSASRAGSSKPRDLSWLQTMMSPGSPADIETLTSRTGRSAPDVLAELGRLEVTGAVTRLAGGKYVRLD